MRDQAARCGFRGYMALPLLDLYTNQCCGVLELLSGGTIITSDLLSTMDMALEIAGFKSTHIPISISRGFSTKMQLDSEIKDMCELVMATVPRLYLAQVWVPYKQHQCLDMINTTTTNVQYMEITTFISYQHKIVYSHVCLDVIKYLVACNLHNLQIDDLRCLDSGIGDDLCISKNPLAHYARKSRLSHSFAVSLENVYDSNHFYVIQFFHQPKFRHYSLLLRMMKMNLKDFKFVSEGGLLVSELPREPNAIDCESTDSLDVIKSYKQKLSESNFTTYLEMDDSCCQRPSPDDSCHSGIDGNSLNLLELMKEKIKILRRNIQLNWSGQYWIIQFWAPKIVEDRCHLEALDQPYVVGCLSKGLASFRKKCMTHSYFVDDQAKEDELGPPGRVFRNGHPEISHDLYQYTTEKYPIRNYAMHFCTTKYRGYFAFPIFEDEHNHKCVGVLEFVGISHLGLQRIGKALKEAELWSTHTDMYRDIFSLEQPFRTIYYCKEEAFTEVGNALELILKIPQVHMANVWVSNGSCVSIKSNMSCMELAWSTNCLEEFMPVRWIHVKTRKGMIGMVLASESKSCLCRNLRELSIVDQPLSHFDMGYRRDVCFAICLQSSHSGDLLYVAEFFLNQDPASATCEYFQNFLNILLLIMKNELKSFKIASGKELGDELVVDIIEFFDEKEVYFSESEVADVFPIIKFKSVPYYQKEYEHSEEQQAEECSAAASDSKRKRGKQKKHLHLSLEDLQPHFHKTEKGSAEALGVSLSTLKRACRRLDIAKWPGQGERKHRKNTSRSIHGSESTREPSTSNLQPILDTNTKSTHHVIEIEEDDEEDAERVIIKVKCEEDIIKFVFCLSLGLAKLMEQVGTRLNLEIGSFKLKYCDEDGDDILLTKDADLHLCGKSQITTMHKTFIQLFIR